MNNIIQVSGYHKKNGTYIHRHTRHKPIFNSSIKLPDGTIQKVTFLEKPRNVMHDDIALNWLEPEISKQKGIKKGQVFVRKDWSQGEHLKRLKTHEMTEINLRLRNGMNYTEAHEIANKFEHNSDKHLKGRK